MEEVPVPAVVPRAQPVNPADFELFLESLRVSPDRKDRFLRAMREWGAEALCNSETLSTLNGYFSFAEIEEILRAGFLKELRS